MNFRNLFLIAYFNQLENSFLKSYLTLFFVNFARVVNIFFFLAFTTKWSINKTNRKQTSLTCQSGAHLMPMCMSSASAHKSSVFDENISRPQQSDRSFLKILPAKLLGIINIKVLSLPFFKNTHNIILIPFALQKAGARVKI